MNPHTSLGRLHADISRYYSAKVAAHGATPAGADWVCAPTQELRFVQLLRVCEFEAPLSLNDLGCGYGALLGFLRKRHRGRKIDYLGIDLSPTMVDLARQKWRRHVRATFTVGSQSARVADYSVASGLFNVQQDQPRALWTRFVKDCLANLYATSTKGFAVNFLAPLPPDMTPKAGLYRPDPCIWIDHCIRTFGHEPELVTDYGLCEFTLLVRRGPPADSLG